MEKYGIQWKKLGTHRKHLSVLDYEKQERAKEVAELDKQIEKSETALRDAKDLVDNRLERAENLAKINENLSKSNDRLHTDNSKLENAYTEAEQCHSSLSEKNRLLQVENENLRDENAKLQSGNSDLEKRREKLQEEVAAMADFQASVSLEVRSLEREKQWQLPEPGAFTNAKSYYENTAKPLVTKLKEFVKSLITRCASLSEQVRKLTDKVKQQAADIDWYRGKLLEQANITEKFQEQAADLERVKLYAGAGKVQEMVEAIKAIERQLKGWTASRNAYREAMTADITDKEMIRRWKRQKDWKNILLGRMEYVHFPNILFSEVARRGIFKKESAPYASSGLPLMCWQISSTSQSNISQRRSMVIVFITLFFLRR